VAELVACEATWARKRKKAVAELATSEATPTRKEKKAVAELAAFEATPTCKGKKAVAELASSEATLTCKGKKAVGELAMSEATLARKRKKAVVELAGLRPPQPVRGRIPWLSWRRRLLVQLARLRSLGPSWRSWSLIPRHRAGLHESHCQKRIRGHGGSCVSFQE
jgi:hypothetical protein